MSFHTLISTSGNSLEWMLSTYFFHSITVECDNLILKVVIKSSTRSFLYHAMSDSTANTKYWLEIETLQRVSGCYNFIPKKSKPLTLVWSEYNLAIISLSQLFVVCSASRSKASVLSSNSCSDLQKWFTRWHPIKDRYLCWLYDTLFHSHLLIWLFLE